MRRRRSRSPAYRSPERDDRHRHSTLGDDPYSKPRDEDDRRRRWEELDREDTERAIKVGLTCVLDAPQLFRLLNAKKRKKSVQRLRRPRMRAGRNTKRRSMRSARG